MDLLILGISTFGEAFQNDVVKPIFLNTDVDGFTVAGSLKHHLVPDYGFVCIIVVFLETQFDTQDKWLF